MSLARCRARSVLSALVLPLFVSLAVRAAEPPTEPPSFEESIQAAQAALARLAASPPPARLGSSYDADAERARQEFLAWQIALLKQHASMPPELARVLKRKSYVDPLPLVPSPGPADQPPSGRLTLAIPIIPDPTGYFTRYLQVSVGKPDFYVGLKAQAEVASIWGVKYRNGAAYVADGGLWQPRENLEFSTSGKSGRLSGGVVVQSWAAQGGPDPLTGQLGLKCRYVEAAVSYNSEGRLSGSLFGKLLRTPAAFSWLMEASVGLEVSGSAPVTFMGVTRGPRTGIAGLSEYLTRRIMDKLSGIVECPRCHGRGELTCGTCQNRRAITCPGCQGQRSYACKRCKGSGTVDCSKCKGARQVKCRACSGTGQPRCTSCRGKGYFAYTTWEEHEETYQDTITIGTDFDGTGSGSSQTIPVTRTRTVSVPTHHRDTCETCNGTRRVGTCGKCGGAKQVPCDRCTGSGVGGCGDCKSTGRIPCGKCKGTGQIPCTECKGKPITCTLCHGKKTVGGN